MHKYLTQERIYMHFTGCFQQKSRRKDIKGHNLLKNFKLSLSMYKLRLKTYKLSLSLYELSLSL